MKILSYWLLYSMITFLPVLGYADDSAFSGTGVNVYPLQHSDIQLVSEVITISDDKGSGGRWSIHINMFFKNHGPDTTVQMGFPLFTDHETNEIMTQPDFRTWVNDKEVSVTLKRGVPNPEKNWHFSDTVYTYDVLFKKGETKNIVHSYSVGGWTNVVGHWGIGYILKTGALWKGPIEDLKIVLKANKKRGALGIRCITPREHSVEEVGDDIVFKWHYTNIKPKFDIEIRTGQPTVFWLADDEAETSILDQIPCSSSRKEYPSCNYRFDLNRAFAYYGYPFKNPLYRNQFYFEGSPYKEDPKFTMKKIPQNIMKCIDYLSKIEQEKVKEEEGR